MLRVLQIGLGPLGQQVLRDLGERRLGALVGALDTDPGLAGRALREVMPGLPARCGEDLVVSPELAGAPDADVAIVTTSSWLPDCAPLFEALLERGLAVVSTCEELAWPWLKHPALADALDARARAAGGRLLGTGVNPGFLMDTLPLALTAVAREVRAVEIERVQDAARRRLSFQRKVGVGLTTAEFAERAASGRFGHAGLHESLAFVAANLGFEVGPIEGGLEPVIAERELESGLGPVAPGRVRGLRETACAATADGETIELTFEAVAGCEDPRDRVAIEGAPPLDLRIEGGVHGDVATSSIVLNAMRTLVDAPAGLHTMASLPPVRWRRAPE